MTLSLNCQGTEGSAGPVAHTNEWLWECTPTTWQVHLCTYNRPLLHPAPARSLSAVAKGCLGAPGVHSDSVSGTVLQEKKAQVFSIHVSATLGRFLPAFNGVWRTRARQISVIWLIKTYASTMARSVGRSAPVSIAGTCMASPSSCFQLLCDHPVHESMTKQKDRAFTAKGLKSLCSLNGPHPRLAGRLTIHGEPAQP